MIMEKRIYIDPTDVGPPRPRGIRGTPGRATASIAAHPQPAPLSRMWYSGDTITTTPRRRTMRTTPPPTKLTPNGALSVSVPHALPRPWSAPIPVPAPRYRGLKGFFVGLAMGAVCAGLTAAGLPAGGFTAKASLPEFVSPAPLALASAGCSYRIEPETHRELVVDTDVAGRIMVWHKGRAWIDTPPRFSYVAPAHDVEYFNLKRRHRDVSHFQVAVVAVGRRHNDEQVTWCEPA